MVPFSFYLVSLHLLLPLAIAGNSSPFTPIDYIFLSCGESSNTIADDGRKWIPDERSKFSISDTENASFAAVAAASAQDHSVTQVPYTTARVFHDKFTYSFPVSPGLKFLRFYFYPTKYSALGGTTSFFSVTANNYLLLQNFSAYLTLSAQHTPSASLIKEFMVLVFETEKLDVTFLPSPNSFAFVNGIEIVSMPNNMYRNHQPNLVTFVNHPVPFDIPDTTAFETAYRLNIGGATIANVDDTGMFRTWKEDSPYIFGAAVGTTPMPGSDVVIRYTEDTPAYTAPDIVYNSSRTMGSNPQFNMRNNLTWLFAIDAGLNYLLRLHFCEYQMEVTLPAFLFIEVVLVPNDGPNEQIDLWLALHPTEDVGSNFADAILNGLEIFRLSKPDGSLAVPNPELTRSLVPKEQFKDYPCFTLSDIQAATNNFDDALVMGRGGFGNVYKGFIKGIKCAVAIKRLNCKSQQGAREFWAEIQMLSQLRYINLVSLIGYCNDDNEMILVDVKSTNILLDENFVAKVSDFGLSKMSPISMTNVPVITVVKGTFGYMDPEYYRRQQLTEKSDVYSFGVVLFEVLCARPAVDSKLEYSQISLANWARRCAGSESIGTIIDPLLNGKISPHSLRTYVNIAENCIRENGLERPTMNDVVQRLEFALQLQEIEDAEQISDGTACQDM
ncbi:hypothetical protein COLO4_08985 [Corchorus olitorius]|uniref:Protein kinase domain-containing protein n=1 Tax=Corchorus olitorius TaxID=93759 RepID=A0A1R3KDV5_9ROSI|nr:hypothetical protein COLO4_08985 [Corchorus olitorius]